jgi:hypothetical protein
LNEKNLPRFKNYPGRKQIQGDPMAMAGLRVEILKKWVLGSIVGSLPPITFAET